MLAYSRPSDHPRISSSELDHLRSHEISAEEHGKSIPITSMLTSIPVHALWITHMCSSWSFYLIVVNLPLFAAEVYHFDVYTVRVNLLLLVFPSNCINLEVFLGFIINIGEAFLSIPRKSPSTPFFCR